MHPVPRGPVLGIKRIFSANRFGTIHQYASFLPEFLIKGCHPERRLGSECLCEPIDGRNPSFVGMLSEQS